MKEYMLSQMRNDDKTLRYFDVLCTVDNIRAKIYGDKNN
jgi:uncharacterized protein YerC